MEKNLKWIDDVAGDAVDAMSDLTQYAIDILSMGEDKQGWRKNWNRSADDGTYDYIPGCFGVIRWLIEAVSLVHYWQIDEADQSQITKFREDNPLEDVYWDADGVSNDMKLKVVKLCTLLGYNDEEMAEGLFPCEDDPAEALKEWRNK